MTVQSKEGVEYRRNSSLVKRYNPPDGTRVLTLQKIQVKSLLAKHLP